MKIYSNKVFYLIGGPNGSGKTTIAREMIGDNPKIAFLNSDDIARERGVTPARAGIILLDQMRDLFATHASFAFETTLAGKYTINSLRAPAKKGIK